MAKKDVSAMVSGAGLITAIFTDLVQAVKARGGSDEDIHRLATPDGKHLMEKFADLIVGTTRRAFKIWKTINLGTGLKTADDFRKAFKRNGDQLSGWASDVLGQKGFAVATKEIEVDLVVVSVAELGFPNGATREKIYTKAKELGLELCPAEVGPQLRLQYRDQPSGEWLLIGMQPITDSDGSLGVFNVERDDDDRWLDGDYGYAGDVWNGDDRWVFLRCK